MSQKEQQAVEPEALAALCPVCGYALGFEPWRGNSASHRICPSCGIEFRFDDAEGGALAAGREASYAQWRTHWIAAGMPWFSAATQPPDAWDPQAQLRRLERVRVPT